ncbi:hypothetical protein Emtol_0838 [Emticicia oligotrophica DSM 17448]|uniref:Uncharacterized protein n=1 Tax=Emticicia oligotrophica (strain DSM 17448 / CIP 109782 / MTCC 6937 / GPTSA100-15) TaxID=929562 RepID=A0ABM5MYG0_EMTOG|nr:hypothetical protein [Emticicia oligotrophica]AFK01989.1 hypothetical protein Emtol_0838 [Emticicia oligotrophica DSM 17448]
MANHSNPSRLSDGVMVLMYLLILTVLWFFGDLFTFIVGLLVISGVFASGYNNNPANHEHH